MRTNRKVKMRRTFEGKTADGGGTLSEGGREEGEKGEGEREWSKGSRGIKYMKGGPKNNKQLEGNWWGMEVENVRMEGANEGASEVK